MVIFGHFVKPIYSKVKKRRVWKKMVTFGKLSILQQGKMVKNSWFLARISRPKIARKIGQVSSGILGLHNYKSFFFSMENRLVEGPNGKALKNMENWLLRHAKS